MFKPTTRNPRSNAPDFSGRIAYFDALRGLAVIVVILYHAFSRWNEIEPFQQNTHISDFFSCFVSAGVILFFCISGYVILLTLEKTQGIGRFALNRWLRLFPAMLLATIFIYATGQFIPERPLGIPRLIDTLPGLLFIGPSTVSDLLGQDVNSLDGAFWSIYAEVRFYIIAALFFYLFRDRRFTVPFVLFGIHFTLLTIVQLTDLESLWIVDDQSDGSIYTWFLLGIGAYLYHRDASRISSIRFTLISIAACIQSAILEPNLVTLILVVLFIVLTIYSILRRVFTNRFLLYFGYISYPLYLIHQNFVTGMAIKLYNFAPNYPPIFYPLSMLIIAIGVAHGIAKLEPQLRRIFTPRSRRRSSAKPS